MIQPRIICVVFAFLILVPTTTMAIYAPAINDNTKDVNVSQTINEQNNNSEINIEKEVNKEEHIEISQIHLDNLQHEHLKYLGTFKVTAYCPCEKCNGRWAGMTAMGVTPKEGITVAVDKRVIPLGTKLYIEGIGEVIAQDTGVKGNSIDLFMTTHEEAKIWGVKQLKVSILK